MFFSPGVNSRGELVPSPRANARNGAPRRWLGENYRVTMTTTLDTSCSKNTMVLSARRGQARVSVYMYFLGSIYLLKNSYYVKIRKLKILTRIGNVFMSECSSLVANDGNINKVKVLSKAIDC